MSMTTRVMLHAGFPVEARGTNHRLAGICIVAAGQRLSQSWPAQARALATVNVTVLAEGADVVTVSVMVVPRGEVTGGFGGGLLPCGRRRTADPVPN